MKRTEILFVVIGTVLGKKKIASYIKEDEMKSSFIKTLKQNLKIRKEGKKFLSRKRMTQDECFNLVMTAYDDTITSSKVILRVRVKP
jgi:hypothetical protein